MTPKTLAAAAFAGLAIAACGTGTRSPTTGPAEDAQAIVWAGCLRSHGIPDFPDPLSGHKAQFPDSVGPIMKSGSPAVAAAEKACQKLSPMAGGAPTGPTTNQSGAMLEYARCMRAHGVPNYPDPTDGTNGRPVAPDLASDGINPESPAFTSAAKECNGHGIPIDQGVVER